MSSNNYVSILRSNRSDRRMQITRLPFFDIFGEPVLLNHQNANVTKKKIIQMLKHDDNDIALNKLIISLLCPIMKTQMKIPARSKICSHLQCFDLENFLQLNEKTATWKCPFCNGNASYDNLIVDQYFMGVLQMVKNSNFEEIELLQNGNWKIVDNEFGTKVNTSVKLNNIEILDLNEDVISLDGSDDDEVPVERLVKPTRALKRKSAVAPSSPVLQKVKKSEIIIVDSSDDERNIATTVSSAKITDQVKVDADRISKIAMDEAVKKYLEKEKNRESNF